MRRYFHSHGVNSMLRIAQDALTFDDVLLLPQEMLGDASERVETAREQDDLLDVVPGQERFALGRSLSIDLRHRHVEFSVAPPLSPLRPTAG